MVLGQSDEGLARRQNDLSAVLLFFVKNFIPLSGLL
jgi:hypothetical protein